MVEPSANGTARRPARVRATWRNAAVSGSPRRLRFGMPHRTRAILICRSVGFGTPLRAT
jgi:hypothetical protein